MVSTSKLAIKSILAYGLIYLGSGIIFNSDGISLEFLIGCLINIFGALNLSSIINDYFELKYEYKKLKNPEKYNEDFSNEEIEIIKPEISE